MRYLFMVCQREAERVVMDSTDSISMRAVRARKMNRENMLLPMDIIILRILYIRLMQAIFRRYWRTKGAHGWRYIRGVFFLRTLSAIRLSYMRRRMISAHSRQETPGK